MKRRSWPLGLFPFLLLSCAQKPVANIDIQKHAVVAGKEGLPRRTEIKNGKVEISDQMNAQENQDYLAPMMKAVGSAPVRHGKRQILIFIHGGMNLQKGAVARSANLTTPIKEAGYHPIFIDWNSAPLSSYTEHLLFVRQGERRPILGPLSAPIWLATDVARGVSRAPAVWYHLAHSALEQPGPIVKGKGARKRVTVAQELQKDERRATGHGPRVTNDTLDEGDQRSTARKLAGWPHALFFLPKAATATVIDIVGTGAWDMMLRRSQQLFESPTRRADLDAQDKQAIDEIARIVLEKRHNTAAGRTRIHELAQQLKEPDPPKMYRGAEYLSQARIGAVAQFLEELEYKLGPRPETRYSITLVGHSMGAIISNEILLRHPQLPIDNIVYMAAACSIEECQRAVGSYLKSNPRAQFYNLCLHPYAEVGESNPSIPAKNPQPIDYLKASPGYLIPRGSLLVWLDHFFTKPVTLGGRRLGKWNSAITTAGGFPSAVRDRVHIKMFPLGAEGDGPRANPEKHGEFANEDFATPFWQPLYWNPNPKGEPPVTP